MPADTLPRRAPQRLRALLHIAIATLGLVLGSLLLSALVVPALPEAFRLPVLAQALWGGILAGYLVTRGASPRLERPRLPWRTMALLTAATIAASQIGGLSLGYLVTRLTGWSTLDSSYISEALAASAYAYPIWIVMVVWGSAAFGEELLFRGFLLSRLEAIFGSGRNGLLIASAGQAALFGLSHATQGPTGVVVTGFVGLVMAWAYYKSGRNLWVPILAHGLIDTIALTLMALGASI